MTTVVFNGVTEDGKPVKFGRSSGCLCILGKTSSHLSEIAYKMKDKGMTEILTLDFTDMHCSGPKPEHQEVLERYMGLFPFMRCVLTSPADMLKGATPKISFDAKNYTLNEVMFAMFHLRNMLGTNGSAIYTNYRITCLEMLHKLHKDYNLPFWMSLVTVLSCIGRDRRYDSSSSMNINNEHLLHNDGSSYHWSSVDVKNLGKLLSGNIAAPEYQGGTITENTNNNNPYTKNIRQWLSRGLVKSSVKKLLCDVDKQYYENVNKILGSRPAQQENLFQPSEAVQKTQKDLSEAERVMCLRSAWDKVVADKKIDTEGWLC